MKCPVCKDINLVMSERQGVEIDYCPSCRGVWLDRGELDKIIEKSSHQTFAYSQSSYQEPKYSKDSHKYENYHNQGHHKKKKEGFLSEIFDFDF